MKSASVIGCYAFTLIELLVVISIIALLIAMLTLGLEKARISAHTVQYQGSSRELNVEEEEVRRLMTFVLRLLV